MVGNEDDEQVDARTDVQTLLVDRPSSPLFQRHRLRPCVVPARARNATESRSSEKAGISLAATT